MSLPRTFVDQENATRDLSATRVKPTDENGAGIKGANSAVSKAKQIHPGRKSLGRAPLTERVPLGGKDGNAALPTLSRSQSTIDRSSFNLGRQRRLPTTSKPPSMSRSSSSLGFIHQTKPKEEDTTLKHSRNTIFNPRLASRSPELLQDDLDTDSLRKQIIHGDRKQDLSSSLPETFTSNTAQLSSTNVPRRRLVNVDPVKRGSNKSNSLNNYLRDPSRHKLYLDLINDENSIEHGPVPVLNDDYTPMDGSPSLSESDLATLAGDPGKNDVYNDYEDNQDLDLDFGGINFDEDLEMNDVKRKHIEEPEKELGLTEDDLNDLLDF